MKLSEQIDSIRTRKDLAAFLRALRADLDSDQPGWENADLGRYLAAMAAWVEDMDGYYQNRSESVPEQPDWRMLAEILIAAKVYE